MDRQGGSKLNLQGVDRLAVKGTVRLNLVVVGRVDW